MITPKWLEQMGKAGETIAWVIALVETKLTWGIFFSVVMGALAGSLDKTVVIFSDQHVLVAIRVALICFAVYVGVRVLKYSRTPIHTIPEPDFRYCISQEALLVGVNPNSEDLAFSFMTTIRNVGAWPIRVRVKKFNIRVSDRACNDPDKEISIVIPRFGARSIRSGGFKREIMQDQTTGSMDMELVYGDPDSDSVRCYHFKAKLNFLFIKNEAGQYTAGTVSEEPQMEEDRPYP